MLVFPTETMKAWEVYTDYQEGKASKEEFEKHREKWFKKFVYRGTFTDKDALLNLIENDKEMYHIHEGWYDYMLIEKYNANQIDGLAWGLDFDHEMWFKAYYNSETGDFGWNRIERPECFKGTIGFM
jgi:hypothetical protein